MSKSANAGELNTSVYFKRIDRETDADGFPIEGEVNIFGQDANGKDIPARGKWVNVHGSEVFIAMQLQLKDPAFFTTRYSPLYNQMLVAYKEGDKNPYEIISIDDVENRHTWLEIKLQRKEPAR